ncbi:MAG: hypothetical protein K2Z81_22485 [Cyanobacteria bacterium]|nr:hypothetical protein [Cyanobacteriota bacterium]
MSTNNAKLTALQLLGLAERIGIAYLESSDAWSLDQDEESRLRALRKQYAVSTTYRLTEEALTDLDILLPEYPTSVCQSEIADPAQTQAEAERLLSELHGLDPEQAMAKMFELLPQMLSKQMSKLKSQKAFAAWDKLIADKRTQAEVLENIPAGRAESASRKLEMALAIAFKNEEHVTFVTPEVYVTLLGALQCRREVLSEKQELVALRIAARTKQDDQSQALLKAVRMNQSANVLLEAYRRSIASLNNDFSEVIEEATAMIDRQAADNEQLAESLEKGAEIGVSSDQVTEMFASFTESAVSQLTDSKRPSTVTTFFEAADLELSLAEQLVAEAEAALK